MDNGYFLYGDGTTLGSANVPWGNVYGVPSIVLANTKYNGNESIGRGVYSGNNPRNGNNCNCSGINLTGTYISFDSGSSWDMYYYYDNCDCNCRCNCGKIICTKLHELGLLPTDVFTADQEFGEWLVTNHPDVYNGYVAWAQIVVDWMEGNGPNVLPGMEESRRNNILKQWAIKWAKDIATPWAEHIAGKKTLTGKFLYWTGVPICKTIGIWQRVFGKSDKKAGFVKGVALIHIFVLFKLVVEFGRFIESFTVEHKAA
jgi:hypothetical protein